MLSLLVLFACSGGAPDPTTSDPTATPGAPEAAASADAVAPAAKPSAPASKHAEAPWPPLASEAAHAAAADTQLVIVHTGPPGAEAPAGVAALKAHATLGGALQRLDSSQLRNLMPCYEIIVAGAFSSQAEAKARAKELRELGVDHYIKPAGAHVVDPRLAGLCSAPEPSDCDAAPRMALGVDGVGHLALNLEPAIAERALANLGAARPVEGDHTWAAPLPAQTLGDVTVGQAWTLKDVDSGATRACTVSGFAALIRGQPHFGWVQSNPEPERPSCGEPVPYAKLDCSEAVQGESWVAAPAGQALTVYARSAEPVALAGEFEAVIRSAAGGVLDEAEAWSEEQGAPVTGGVEVLRWTATGAPPLVSARLTVQTGDGHAECGGDDYLARRFAVWEGDTPSAHKVGVHDITARTPEGLVRVDDRVYSLERSWFGATLLVGADGEDACSLPFEFCDCAC